MIVKALKKQLIVMMTAAMLIGGGQAAFAEPVTTIDETTTTGSGENTAPETEAATPETEATVTPETEETPDTIAPVTPQKKYKGLVKIKNSYYFYKNGARLKNKWKQVNGKKYYFKNNGKAATGVTKVAGTYYMFSEKGQLQTAAKTKARKLAGKEYLVSKDGKIITGFQMLNGKFYYFSKEKKTYGQKQFRTTVNGVKLGKDGAATNGATMIQAHVKALSILNSITNSGMSKGQKLAAAWNYVVSHISYAGKYPNLGNGLWPRDMALNVLSTGSGNCYGYACAFAALAYEAGYSPVLVYGRVPGRRDGAPDGYTRHCWVEINGLSYDPEAQAAGWGRGIYGTAGYPMGYAQGRTAYRLY